MRQLKALMRARGASVVVVVALAIAVGVLLHLSNAPLIPALGAMLRGAFGSWYALGSGTLVRATPLILTGLSVAIAFRAGVFNIGAEGQFTVGAAAAAAVALGMGSFPRALVLIVVLVSGALAGGAWAAIAALLRLRFNVLEVISTIMLNFVAAYGVSYLVRGPLQEPTHVYPQTSTFAAAAYLPRLGPLTRLHVGFVLAVAACGVAWWSIRSTPAGFRLRAVGANPNAARSAGEIDVARVTATAFVLSGALAGVAGAVEVTGVTYALYENISPGYGFTAIAVALLARLNPLGVIATGTLFGALEAGATAMQRDAGVPSVLVSVIEAGIILALLAAAYLRPRAATEQA